MGDSKITSTCEPFIVEPFAGEDMTIGADACDIGGEHASLYWPFRNALNAMAVSICDEEALAVQAPPTLTPIS